MATNLSCIDSYGAGVDSTRSSGTKEKTLVVVKWRDIISCSGWEKADDVTCPVFFSVGWLVSKDEDVIKIASTLDYDDYTDEAKGEAKPIPYGITALPTGCVVDVKFI
jgi:hypothetical protein